MITKLIDKDKALEKLKYREPVFGRDYTKERYRYMQWQADVNAIEELKPEKAIVIPEGATNGDMIRAMYPDAQIDYHEESELVDSYITVFLKDCDTCQDYSYDWWNTPYRAESEAEK